MTYRQKTLSLAVLALVAVCQAQAQGLRLPNASSPSPVAAKVATAQADFIIAVVNSEPGTKSRYVLAKLGVFGPYRS